MPGDESPNDGVRSLSPGGEPSHVRHAISTPAAFVVLLLVAACVGLPLCWGRVLAGQDIVTYLINAQQTAANLREGAIFPAWGGGFNAGFGSPALLFYPPLTSYVHAIPVLVGAPVIVGVGFLSLLAHLLSGLAVWWWLSSIGLRRGALPASVVYMIAPYRWVDLYLRSALSEHWAFIWPPLLLLVAGHPRVRGCIRVPVMALLVAALLLTNLPLAVLFGIGLAAWFVTADELRGKRAEVVFGTALGFGLAAFQLVPQALSSSLLELDRFYGSASDQFRPSANTLFSSGFREWNLNTEFSLCFLATFGLIVAAFALLSPVERRARRTRLAFIAACGCVAAATGPAGPIWDVLPIVSKIQFPWRLTAVLSLLAASIVARLEARRAVVLVLLAVVVAVPFANWDRSAPRADFDSPRPQRVPPGSVFPDPHTAWEASSGGWYWRHHNLAEIWLIPKNTDQAMFADLAGEYPPEFEAIRQRPAVLLDDPSSPIRVLEWGQMRRTIEIDAPVAGTLIWRVVYFPDVRVMVNGAEVQAFPEPETGLVAHTIFPGKQRINWAWGPFPALQWGRMVSVGAAWTLLVLFCLGLLPRRRKIPLR